MNRREVWKNSWCSATKFLWWLLDPMQYISQEFNRKVEHSSGQCTVHIFSQKKSTNWRQENNKVYLFYHWFTSAHLYSYKVLDSTVVVYRLMTWTFTSQMAPTRHEDLCTTAFPNSIIMLGKEGRAAERVIKKSVFSFQLISFLVFR